MADKVIGLAVDLDAGTAPTVVVKASGAAAAHVIQQAEQREHIPVIKDDALAQALYRLPIDSPVGKELFPVVAALIAHVITVDHRNGASK